MPVAVKLSKTFYDRFGHGAADELVGVLNQVDAASQNSLREMNELNFARFDAKLEQRIAELRAELKGEIVELRAELKGELKALSASLAVQMANLATQLRDQQVVHMRWMIGMWFVVLVAVMAPWFRH